MSEEHKKAVDQAMCDLDDFINQCPVSEEKRMVREYRHELYPKFEKLVLMLSVFNSANESTTEQLRTELNGRYEDINVLDSKIESLQADKAELRDAIQTNVLVIENALDNMGTASESLKFQLELNRKLATKHSLQPNKGEDT